MSSSKSVKYLLGTLHRRREQIASLQRQATADPGSTKRQQDLSRAPHSLGEEMRNAGEMPGGQDCLQAALENFRASLAIMERLVKVDPGYAEWQRDLFIAHKRVGEVLQNQGNLAAALASYRAALPIAESLAESRPRHVRSHLDLYFAHTSIAMIEVRMGERGRALDAFKAARAVMAQLRSELPDDPNWPIYLGWIDGEVAKLNG